MFSLGRDAGQTQLDLSPVGDGIHYQSVSTADGVVLDGRRRRQPVDAFDASSGAPTGAPAAERRRGYGPVTNVTSAACPIAPSMRCSPPPAGASYETAPGFVIAYRAG